MPVGGGQPIGDAAVVGADDAGQSIALSLTLGGLSGVLVEPLREKPSRAADSVRNTLSTLDELGIVDRCAVERARKHLLRSKSIAGSGLGCWPNSTSVAHLGRTCEPQVILRGQSVGCPDQPAR